MTKETDRAERDQADAALRSAQTLAGDQPTERSADQRRDDDVPLEEGAVRNGGAYQGGKSPEMSSGNDDGRRDPLDAREHFGGDGAQFVDESETPRGTGRRGTAPDDDGYDATAGRPAGQDA